MRRFWITFELPPEPERPRNGVRLDGDPWGWLRRGVGVTAESADAAIDLARGELAAFGELPPVREVLPDFDVSTLDEKHMLPSIVGVTWRGVWWPPGFTRWHGDE
jgi:hypothetical protein